MKAQSFNVSFRIISVICMIVLNGALHAQSSNETINLKKIITPSPTAAALGQYGNTPVGLYTGTPQVSVPLYEIQEGSLKLPISLSYHAGGIKISEMASWVGLGWSLNAGGSISRTVYGLPDEGSINDLYVLTKTPPTRAEIKKSLMGQIDGQPDAFYFNFNGKSGKFFINRTGVVPVSPHQNLKIQAYWADGSLKDAPFTSLNTALQFRITDEDGVIYEFRDYETNRTITFPASGAPEPDVTQQGNPEASITAWYMTRMISPTGDTIRFVYSDYQLDYDVSSTVQRFVNISSSNPSQPSLVVNVTKCRNHNKRLSQILFSNGSIRFSVNDARLDLKGDSALNRVSMLDANGKMIKGYDFQYSSTGLPPGGEDNSYSSYVFGTSTASGRRLTLLGLSELDTSGAATGKKYSFTYNNTWTMPSRFSKARDYWGYWNGAADNDDNFLNYQVIGTERGDPANYMVTNKEPDLSYSVANNLIKITYPTGGYTQFNYELNDAYLGRGVLPPQLVTQNNVMGISFPNYNSQGYVDTVISSVHCKYKLFNVNTGEGATPTITIAGMKYQSPGLLMKFDLYTANNQPVLSMREIIDDPLTTTTLNTTTQVVQYVLSHFLSDGTYKILFTPDASYIGNNNYATQYGTFPSYTVNGWSNIVQNPDSVNITRSIGGLRISSVINFDPVSNATTKKEYSYKLPGDTLSSGTIVWSPVLVSTTSEIGRENFGSGLVSTGPYSYIVINEESNAPLTTTQGSNVGYERVTVTERDISAGVPNGMSEYKYTTSKTFPDIYGVWSYGAISYPDDMYADVRFYPEVGSTNSYPFVPADDRDWQRGLLLQQTDYKYVSEHFTQIRNETHTYYPPVYMDTVIGWLARYNQIATPTVPDTVVTDNTGIGIVVSPSQEAYAVRAYGFTEGYVLPATKAETLTDDNGNSLTTTEYYTYGDAPGNLLPTVISTTNSKAETTTIHNTYPFDYTVGGSPTYRHAQGLFNLQQRHMLSPVIEKYIQRSNNDGSNLRTVSGVYSSYKPTQALPDSIFRLELGQALSSYTPVTVGTSSGTMNANYKPALSFGVYDSRGNLLQQNKAGDASHSYIWDYQGIYPIAEVVNALPAEIAYTSFEADGPGNWTIGSAARTSGGAITGNRWYTLSSNVSKSGLSNGNTYMVSYWTKNSSPFSITGTITGFPVKGKTSNGWTFYVHKVTGQTTITINGSGAIDELRLYPASALMTTYTFQPLIGMTSQSDATGKITYYEYDGLQRLLRIRDMDGNIIKQFEYQYQVAMNCGTNCSILPMTTLAGTNTIGYPVGVFNANGKLLGNAANQAQYISLWNADTADQHRGMLAAGADPLHFQFTLVPGKTIPAITGCRYYQFDLLYNKIDAIRNTNGTYVDFGDGTGMRLAPNISDSLTVLAPNTTQAQAAHPEWNAYAWYFVHTYPDNSLKTLTFYHNDASEHSTLDNNSAPATSLTYLRNLRGNFPQYMQELGGSCYQDTSALTVANITNWNTMHSIKKWAHGSGDGGITPNLHMGYQQDFMAGNRDLETINTAGGENLGYFDSTFKISRLKSDWNTYFTHLKSVAISDAHWNRENLSALKELNGFLVCPARQLYSNSSTQIPIPASVIDNIFIQIAAGAGQTVTNGSIFIYAGGTNRTAASDTAVAALLAKGWTLYLNGVQLH